MIAPHPDMTEDDVVELVRRVRPRLGVAGLRLERAKRAERRRAVVESCRQDYEAALRGVVPPRNSGPRRRQVGHTEECRCLRCRKGGFHPHTISFVFKHLNDFTPEAE